MTLVLVPRFSIAAIAATEISEAIKAYSIAVAPRTQRRSFVNWLMDRSRLTIPALQDAVASDSPLCGLRNSCGSWLTARLVNRADDLIIRGRAQPGASYFANWLIASASFRSRSVTPPASWLVRR